jgi:predicted HTH domain antitoxin
MQITLDISEELAGILHETGSRDDRAIVIETVCSLYSRGRISSAKAARMLGLDRQEFQDELSKREIPLHYTLDDLHTDIAHGRR